MDESLHFWNSAYEMDSALTEILKFISHKNAVKEWLTVMAHGPRTMGHGQIHTYLTI